MIVYISAFTDSATARAYGRSSNCGPSSKAPVNVLKRPPWYARAAKPVTMLESRPPLRYAPTGTSLRIWMRIESSSSRRVSTRKYSSVWYGSMTKRGSQ